MLNTTKITNAQGRTTLKLLLIFAAFTVILLSGCDLSSMGFRDTTKGALGISINSSRFAASRSITPAADMTPADYIVTGSGPNGETFERTSTGGALNVYDLAVGSWSINVTARNAAGAPIGWGESLVSVSASVISDVSVLVEPYSGTGSVDFTVTWNDADITSPSVAAVLTDSAGTATDLIFNVGTGMATFSDPEVSAGYYTLNIKLLDGGIEVAGLVETVRVIQDFQTSGNFNFTDLNSPSGDVAITIAVNMYEPFEPAIIGALPTIAYGSDMTVNASVPESEGESLNYYWYANGELAGNTETITFGSTLRWGSYRLDLVVTNDAGSRSGSASHYFTVE